MSMSALPVVIRPPEPGIEFDVEAGDRVAPSTYVETPACGALAFPRTVCVIRAGILSVGDDETPPVFRLASSTMRPAHLICGDHRRTGAHMAGLGGGRSPRQVEDFIHPVWRAEPMSTHSTALPRQYF
jgi:hypothetical protein